MTSKIDNRIRWRCRRGKLELDLFLLPFFDNCYAHLTQEEQQDFVALLEEHDPTLQAYLMGEEELTHERAKKMITQIRAYKKRPLS